MSREDAQVHLAYLIWCWQEGYVTPYDREIVPNWLRDESLTSMHPDDVVTRANLLQMADEVLTAFMGVTS